jgi:hypothetical protein
VLRQVKVELFNPLQHGRYLQGSYLFAILEVQALQSKGVGKKAL